MSTTSPTTSQPTSMRRVAAAAVIGTSIEWYDFFVYAQAAALALNVVFFPEVSPLTGVLILFATMGVGFVARPLGAIIFGHIGDRIGRKKTLIITLLMMGVATFAMGLLPGYDAWGAAAPVLLVALRLCQGLAAGGEWGGAALIGVEHAPPEKKALFGSFAQLGSPIGLVLATSMTLAVNAAFGQEAMQEWAWRIPFLASIVLIPIGFIIRSKVAESPEFAALSKQERSGSVPIVKLFRFQTPHLLVGIGSFAAVFLTYYLMTSFMLVYATDSVGLSSAVSLPANLIAAVVEGVFIVIAAVLSVRIGTKRINVVSAVALLLWAFPSFYLAAAVPPWGLYVSVGVSMVFVGAAYGVLASDVARLFTTDTRYTGASLSYHLAAVIGGGLAPIAATAILEATGGDVFFIALIPAVTAAVMIVCVLILPRLQQPDVAGEGEATTADGELVRA
ncbi:MFS transporter [Agromyces sp. NBRC 114283]|uniref:MFS transporter n=1 Tax=Agromyces sp. NBRC 114283 TaxID=2994521 RepID=UPI0024A29EF3|nr:MFS transporter [Agromyces sp. NBRC 114283]GLU89026.1 MFS transporter [Agromyces sp. NBRC 114283]